MLHTMRSTAFRPSFFAQVLLFAAMISSFAGAKDFIVGGDGFEEHIQGSGASTQADRLSIAEGGVLYKNGNGNWTVPGHVFQQLNPATLGLKRGPMTLRLDETAENRLPPVVPDILQSALFWVDASLKTSRPELFTAHGTSDSQIEKWYDARETNPSVPSYLYGHANFVTNYTDTWPSYVEKNGFPAVYFNGVGSGTAMDWILPDGTPYGRLSADDPAVHVKHVFAVHGVESSYGFIFGSHGRTHFHPAGYVNAAVSLSEPIWTSVGHAGRNDTTWLDGSMIDACTHKPEKGFHVLEVATNLRHGYADVFFRDRSIFNAGAGWRSGGDYLCEVIVFTNALTEIQRTEINAYLTAKWFPERQCEKHVLLGGDPTSLMLTVDAQVNGTVRIAGTGDVIKTGSGDLRLGLIPGHRWSGALTIEEGTVTYLAPFPVPAKSGVRLSATDKGAVTCIENGTDSDGLIKTGPGDTTITGLPANLKHLSVQAGRLVFSGLYPPAESPQSASTELEISIGNPGFEEWDESDMDLFYRKLTSTVYHGWGNVGGETYLINYTNWPLADRGIDNASRNAWGLLTPPPGTEFPTSTTAMFLRNQDSHPYHALSVSRGGRYELSFDISGRESMGRAYLLHVFFMNAGGNVTLADFGHVLYSGWKGTFQRQRLTAYIPANSSGNLHLKGLNTADTGLVVDNFRLRYLSASEPDEVDVPGGDFESSALIGDSANSACVFSTANAMPGWTFTQSPHAADGETTVGLATHGMPSSNQGEHYSGSRGPGHGYAMVHFVTNGTAAVTFTPPAGKWYVRAKIAGYDVNTNGMLSLSVKTGEGEAKNLGTATTSRLVLHDETWACPFTADGETAVTLTFDFTMTGRPNYSGGLFLDDVRLVPADALEAGTFDMPTALAISVSENAGLVLDFSGTNTVASVRYAGLYVQGIINAADYEWVSGSGTLYAPPIGTCLILR